MRSLTQKIFLSLGIWALPMLALAQAPQNLSQLIGIFTGLINPIIALLVGLAVLLFMWGIVKYIAAQGNENSKVTAKNTMFYGILALFVLFSFWGIVELLRGSIFD